MKKRDEKKLRDEVIYVYCVTDKTPEPREAKNLLDKLYFVHHQDIYAVVSKVKESEFGEEQLKRIWLI